MLFIARDGERALKGFEGQTVAAGARRIVCMSSTHVAMLDALGEADRVVGVSGRDYISNEYVSSHPDAVADIGFDGNIDYERLLAQRPDLVLLFGVNGASGMEPKLREMGIPFCYIGEIWRSRRSARPSGWWPWRRSPASASGAKPYSHRFRIAMKR